MLRYMQGIWSAPLIPNPDFKDDPALYKLPPIKYVGFELWQVKAGSIFDNIMVTDSLDEALAFAKETWGKSIEGEKEMKAKIEVRMLHAGTGARFRTRLSLVNHTLMVRVVLAG